MAKTPAERQRERRARIRQDNEAYKQYIENDRQRKCESRKAMTDKELNTLRNKVKKSTQKWRERKGAVAGLLKVIVPGMTRTAYKSPATLGKAKRKVERSLPKSPSKRRAVLQKLIYSENIPISTPQIERLRLSENTVRKVIEFYESDTVSRVMPGKADVIVVRSKDGTKTKLRKRHLSMTVMEAFELFKGAHKDATIQKSKFAELRPQHVLLSSNMPHNVCACKYHSDIIMILEALHRACPLIPLYSRNEFLSICVCSIANEECMSNSCPLCNDAKLFDHHIRDLENLDDTLQWSRWDKDSNGFIVKVVCEGTVKEAIEELKTQMPKFLWHAFVKEKQSSAYVRDKQMAMLFDSDVCLLQMDFAENFTCTFQDEIQSAHWRQCQVTLYTVMAYHRGETFSLVIASDTRDHDKKTVAAFTTPIIDMILSEMTTVKDIHIWTDGPSSQFKNRYIFALLAVLNAKYEPLRLCWNYTATSHGKGPNDALGGNVKAIAHRRIMTRQNIIMCAKSFIEAVEMSGSQIRMIQMTVNEIESVCEELNLTNIWDATIPSIPGTINTHFVAAVENGIQRKFYTDAVEIFANSDIFPKELYPSATLGSVELVAENNASITEHAIPIATSPDHILLAIDQNLPKRSFAGGECALLNTEPINLQHAKRSTRSADPISPRTELLAIAGPSTRRQRKRVTHVKKCKHDDPMNNCGFCGGNYYDDDKGDKEEWVQCPRCRVWFHMTCAGVYGKTYYDFICDECTC